MNKFFISTPIYYINDIPHIGHTCTTVAADVLARYHRQKGDNVFFLTGTDEHGQKVAEAAAKEGLTLKEFCDKVAPRFEEAWNKLNISFDFFIRTTDPRHEKVVSDFLQRIYDNGDVYKAKYEGWYCVGCEKFLMESDLVDGHCPLHPPEKTVWKSEDNWFFRLSKYIPEIIKLTENTETNYIFPEGKRTEILSKLKSDVKDISISREKVEWGIPTPWDKTQTIYVWFDALINYYSATQFVENKKEFWPADLHLLAKDILWFHSVIWQSMLMSAQLPLPKEIFAHSFYLVDGQKMSKSLGNVISPQQLLDTFGAEGTRYLITRSFPAFNDSDIGIARFKEQYNADLANNLGNLVSRVAKLAEDLEIKEENFVFDNDFEKALSNLNFDEAIQLVFTNYINTANVRLNLDTPWKLEKNNPKRIEQMDYLVNNLRKAAFLLKSVIPESSKRIEDAFTGIIKPLEKPLFPRIIL
ncbi:MAG: methionine--tRNA ligase [Candidatus Shapirobacteria bacterium]|nr:methionine--tRNA ligase [Candidatus Shapirobacteria bacterium]